MEAHGLRLYRAKVSQAQLMGAHLHQAYAPEADFSAVAAIAVDLRWANLRKTNFRGADLRYGNFRGANLTRRILPGPT